MMFMQLINWNAVTGQSSDLHEITARAIDTLKLIVDKHAPMKQASRNKQRLKLRKPWISIGILKSTKTKHALYKTHFLSNDPIKVHEFKKIFK